MDDINGRGRASRSSPRGVVDAELRAVDRSYAQIVRRLVGDVLALAVRNPMFSIIFTWWLTILGPEVRADVTAGGRTVGLARGEAMFTCTQTLDAQCFDRGLEHVIGPGVGEPHCNTDPDGWATCNVICAGTCSDPDDDVALEAGD
jgi:hypothetical protein